MRTRTLGVVLAVLLAAKPAVAQDHQHPEEQDQADAMMGMMMQMMPGMMMASPAMILRLREPLGLTDEQVRRLEEIQARTHDEHQRHMQAGMQSMREAAGILEADSPDLARYEVLFREGAGHHVPAHLAMARGIVEARAVLTPEQRSNLRFGTRMMQQMMPEPMGGMMGAGMGRPDGQQH